MGPGMPVAGFRKAERDRLVLKKAFQAVGGALLV